MCSISGVPAAFLKDLPSTVTVKMLSGLQMEVAHPIGEQSDGRWDRPICGGSFKLHQFQ